VLSVKGLGCYYPGGDVQIESSGNCPKTAGYDDQLYGYHRLMMAMKKERNVVVIKLGFRRHHMLIVDDVLQHGSLGQHCQG
jgi:(p)ppGpp synthase/HD superfamily hydrolase